MKNYLALAVFCLAGLPSGAQAADTIQVSLILGKAEVLKWAPKHYDGEGQIKAKAPWKPLKKGVQLSMGDAVRTASGGKIELTSPDGSKVRLSQKSQLVIEKATFQKGGRRQLGFRIWAGQLWAKVAKKLGKGSSFEVRTHNAVAGVRGTTFAVLAQQDLSAVVKVYAGTVGVKKHSDAYRKRGRTQVAGPKRIDRQQWEEIIASQMKQVKISALGDISPAEDFEDHGEAAQWAQWNQQLDGK